jgi:hypothetical protein
MLDAGCWMLVRRTPSEMLVNAPEGVTFLYVNFKFMLNFEHYCN